MAKYRVYITQTWTYADVVDAKSIDQAYEIADGISQDITFDEMDFGDDHIEVEEVR